VVVVVVALSFEFLHIGINRLPSAGCFPQIVGICVLIWARADGDNGDGDDGDGDDGNGDGAGDGDHSTRST
jgi:hypothetical protein